MNLLAETIYFWLMIEHPLPDTDAWVLFYTQANLPVLRHTLHALEKLREHAETVNGRVLSSVILQDPLMTLRVLAYLEENRPKKQHTDITTIERALMMIGLDPFFSKFQNLPLVEDQLKPYPKAQLGLLKSIRRARKATHWAREWAIWRHDLDVDEITVATLLHDITEMLMWCFAPNLQLRVQEMLAQNPGLRTTTAQQEIYGIRLIDLQLALVNAWHLPKLLATLINAIPQDGAEAAGELIGPDNPRVKNVFLAVDLARHSANGWHDAALPDDFKGIEDLLHISHEALLHKLGLDAEDKAEQNQPQ
ncbi:MAG: HDOD domain-containing protein [Sterolibacterium sp.]